MVGSLHLFICSITFYTLKTVGSVPSEVCLQNFKWDDCGLPPEPVMYYWKPGSRCEVGVWRGCLPNLNMFKDEYECVSTCIFAARAMPEDYHSINSFDEDESPPPEPIDGLTTVENATFTTSDTTDVTDNTTVATIIHLDDVQDTTLSVTET